MNKTAIKNFAIWARNKLIADVSYDARLIGITEERHCKAVAAELRRHSVLRYRHRRTVFDFRRGRAAA